MLNIDMEMKNVYVPIVNLKSDIYEINIPLWLDIDESLEYVKNVIDEIGLPDDKLCHQGTPIIDEKKFRKMYISKYCSVKRRSIILNF